MPDSSGDHIGPASFIGSAVNRASTPLAKSRIQMSLVLVCGSTRLTASRLPPGDSEKST